MPACPSCQAEVEEGSDLCLECGEPIGDSPAARLARSEATSAPKAAPASSSAPRVKAGAPPSRPTIPATKSALRKADSDPIAIRCPGCGVPTAKARCPQCGAVLRSAD